jgi:TatA/E family protein of Tat protein translocase
MNIGIPELIVILIVALLVIGPKRMPDVAKALGKGLAEFKRAMDDVRDEMNVREVKEEVDGLKDSLLLKKSYDEDGKEDLPSSEEKIPGQHPAQGPQPDSQAKPGEGS